MGALLREIGYREELVGQGDFFFSSDVETKKFKLRQPQARGEIQTLVSIQPC